MEKQQQILEEQLQLSQCKKNNWPALATELLFEAQWGVSQKIAFGNASSSTISDMRALCEQWEKGEPPLPAQWSAIRKLLKQTAILDLPLAWFVAMSATNAGDVRHVLNIYLGLKLPGWPSTLTGNALARQEAQRRCTQLAERIYTLDQLAVQLAPAPITALDL